MTVAFQIINIQPVSLPFVELVYYTLQNKKLILPLYLVLFADSLGQTYKLDIRFSVCMLSKFLMIMCQFYLALGLVLMLKTY